MPNWCNAEISGHLGRDPEVRYTPAGKAVCNFSVAYNPGKKEDNKPTVWFNCICFGDLAEKLAKELSKGAGVVIKKCSPQIRKWQDRDGKDRETLEWLVWEAEVYRKPESRESAPSYEEPPFDDDSIPF